MMRAVLGLIVVGSLCGCARNAAEGATAGGEIGESVGSAAGTVTSKAAQISGFLIGGAVGAVGALIAKGGGCRYDEEDQATASTAQRDAHDVAATQSNGYPKNPGAWSYSYPPQAGASTYGTPNQVTSTQVTSTQVASTQVPSTGAPQERESPRRRHCKDNKAQTASAGATYPADPQVGQ